MPPRGIILAGGSGSRLRPLTDFVCKQLLAIYDKPLIYYPLTSLILAGIKEILIISTPKDCPILADALGDGSELGISIEYACQDKPRGIADAFIVGESFIRNQTVCMILGDNILHVARFSNLMQKGFVSNKGATIFGFPVSDARRFGIVELDSDTNRVISIEEKPSNPRSDLAVIGLYIYDETVVDKVKSLKPSKRNELEITDLNNLYLSEGSLKCHRFSRGNLWLDAGVFDTFADASELVRLIESRMGMKIGSPEEASYVVGNITTEELLQIAKKYNNSPYGKYLRKVGTE
ncbi:MAG: glucose-1-phosphate thymidylyltransferase RfbA [Nitrospinota bacterium]